MPAPLVERVEPSKERPLPISRDLMAEEPLPTRMPPSGVEEAVPPLAIATMPVTFPAVPPMLRVLVETKVGAAVPPVAFARIVLAPAVAAYDVALPTEVMTPEMLALVVTVAALPETEPVMREEKVLAPEKVLESARSVVEATVMLAVPLKEMPLMVRAVSRAVAVAALPPMESVEVATCRSAEPSALE